MPVDLYVGGVEHAVLHLLYSRFWHKVLYDLNLVSTPEPFRRLINQGYILAAAYRDRSEEHTSELQSQSNLVCRLLLEKKKKLTDKTTWVRREQALQHRDTEPCWSVIVLRPVLFLRAAVQYQ